MDQVKSALQSKTIWSAGVTFVIFALQLLGKNTSMIDVSGVTDQILLVVGGVSSLAAIFFRATATAQVSGVVTPPQK